jgi:hypothetical protein
VRKWGRVLDVQGNLRFVLLLFFFFFVDGGAGRDYACLIGLDAWMLVGGENGCGGMEYNIIWFIIKKK